MAKFLAFLIVAPVAAFVLALTQLPSLIMRAFTFSMLWFWLLVPQGLPVVSFGVALFGLLLWTLVKFELPDVDSEEKPSTRKPGFIMSILTVFSYCAIQLVLGYLLSVFFY